MWAWSNEDPQLFPSFHIEWHGLISIRGSQSVLMRSPSIMHRFPTQSSGSTGVQSNHILPEKSVMSWDAILNTVVGILALLTSYYIRFKSTF